MLTTMMERAVEKQKDFFMCLINFEKAFYTVWHEMLIDRLREIEMDAVDLRLLANLHWDQKALVRIGDDRSSWTEIRRGVTQACVLSPNYFLCTHKQ